MAVPAINSRFDVLGSRSGRALLRISQRLGVLIGLSHRGGTETVIYASLPSQDIGSDTAMASRQKEQFDGVFRIAVQPDAMTGGPAIWATDDTTQGIEAKPLTVGDRIQYPYGSGRFYFIDKEIPVTANGYSYTVHCDACKVLTLGQRS
jgi:hypothetical protein